MLIRPLDIWDDDEVHAFYVTLRDAALEENPDRPIWSERVTTAFLREPTSDEKLEVVAAFEDDSPGAELLGSGMIFLPQLDNLEKVYGGVSVAPKHQRRGVGGALLDHLIELARANGRSTFLGEARYAFEARDEHGYRRFAERHGFAVASTEISRRLDLPVADDQIQAWIDEAAPHHEGYRIETFESVPDDLLPSVCQIANQLAIEAPTGDIEFEAEQTTPKIRRESEERDKRNGITKRETLAIDATGQAVATSVLAVVADEERKVHQWITIVDRPHRGHRLGLAIKAANLRAIQRDFPGRSVVFTSNHEDNDAMVSINEKMGFRPFELISEFQRKLDG